METILSNLLSIIKEQIIPQAPTFTTSADAVMKASGLRLEAIRAIAREQGVDIEDTACRCIDESLLASLADAHIRRLKAYFNNAKRHIAELTGDELATFIDFCTTYQKRQTSNTESLLWSDISTETIREKFIEKVHRLTPPRADKGQLSSLLLKEIQIESHSLKPIGIHKSEAGLYFEDILDKVTQSYLYNSSPRQTKVKFTLDLRSEAKKTGVSARYHIFVSEDEDHQNDVVITTQLLTDAPMMVI